MTPSREAMRPTFCNWCEIQRELTGEACRDLRGLLPENCEAHRDNKQAFQALRKWVGVPQPEKDMKQKVADISVTLAVALGIVLCVSFGCTHVTQEKQPVAVQLADGSSTNIPQRELRPEFKETVETVGSLFGPAGDAVAKCGLAVAALILAEQNRRKLNRHIKEAK